MRTASFVFGMEYNFSVPTPFYHLSISQALLCHPALPEEVRGFLSAWRSEFLFGATAADVQVVSGQSRECTHFFDLPILPGLPTPWQALLCQYPALADAPSLPPEHAAFLAGYLCHLQADYRWVQEIFAPVFGPHCPWGSFGERLYLHNVLRSYLDRCVLPELVGQHTCLSQVEPQGWLPFTADQHLRTWRDLLFPQLCPGARVQTVEVFAARQGMQAQDYYALLDSEERMRREVFVHLAPHQLESYRQDLLADNVQLLSSYLGGCSQDQLRSTATAEAKLS